MPEADAPAAAPQAPPAAPSPSPALEERERSVLAELAREVDAWVTFQGLRRQLGVHQQALARTLRRLEQAGLVAHAGKGYQLTDAGFSALRGDRAAAPSRPVLPVVHALLPPHVAPEAVARQLSRRWFGGLRWYGQSEGPGETSLHWMAERTRVTVRVSPGGVTLEVEDTGDARAFAAARPVLAALAELYGVGAS
ncbi:MAG TPA: MarR family transcriptional regulator [Candidatus Thermoplasmatota archaeon]|nr:MarR family transcriptional regulator [Candidatus Thermoplasmatota archaeon]